MELRHRGDEALRPFTKELLAICRHFNVFERDAVCCGTVTVPQCVALQALLPDAIDDQPNTAATADGTHDIGSLAAFMGVTKSAMTRLVDGMEKRGWVERVRDEKDRRRVTVKHTDAGRNEAERLRALTIASAHAILQNIPKTERANVLRAMTLVHDAVDKALANGGITCC